jgi:hypothetical protein|nr:MAG TPA: Repressor protein CI [Bacteriophage sp.]
MTNCPNNILKVRKASQKSQKEVAITLNVSAPTVSDWEREKKYPTVENLKQLADLFSVSTDYLLRRTNIPSFHSKISGVWDGAFIKRLRLERGETLNYVAQSIGVSPAIYEKYEESSLEPTVADLCRMADHFCAETDTLLNRTFYIETDDGHVVPGYFQVDKNEQHLIEMFRSMNNKGRQKFIDYLDDLVKNENNLLSSAPTAKSGA